MAWSQRLEADPEVTLTTVIHIPDLAGYWSESLGVLQLSLASLRSTAPEDAELLVLDNGSCDDVRDYLSREFAEGSISQLILSKRNLGKVGAWNVLFSAARGDIVSYCDSDVYFRPGWFEASRSVLDAFPEATMVTAQPIPGDLSRHCESTLAGIRGAGGDVSISEGSDLIPAEFVESHRKSLGETPEQYAPRIAQRRDVRVRRQGVDAYVSASHFQFTSRRAALARYFPLPASIPLGDDVELDRRIDKAGAWRLSTTDYLVHHMGNRVPDLEEELPWATELAGLHRPGRDRRHSRPLRRFAWPMGSNRIRKFVKWLHRRTFELLYPS